MITTTTMIMIARKKDEKNKNVYEDEDDKRYARRVTPSSIVRVRAVLRIPRLAIFGNEIAIQCVSRALTHER